MSNAMTEIPKFYARTSEGNRLLRKAMVDDKLLTEYQQFVSKAALVDLHQALACYGSSVDYSELVKAIKSADCAYLTSRFASAKLFLQFPRDEAGKISTELINRYICEAVQMEAMIMSAQIFSSDPDRANLDPYDLRDWLLFLSRFLTQIKKMNDRYVPMWIATASSTLTLFCSSSRGVISIADLFLTCNKHLTHQLLELHEPLQVIYYETNLFTRMRSMRYYEAFTIFESSGSSLENPFGGGYLNPRLNERIGRSGFITFDDFLKFAISWDNKNTKAAATYFFKLLDVHGNRYLTADDLLPFTEGIIEVMSNLPHLYDGRQCLPNPDLLASEIMDIIPKNDPNKVTLSDAILHPTSFGQLFAVLCNSDSCFEYETRDEHAQGRQLSRQVQEMRQRMMHLHSIPRGDTSTNLKYDTDKVWGPDLLKAAIESKADYLEFATRHAAVFGNLPMEPGLSLYCEWESQEQLQQEVTFRRLLPEKDRESLGLAIRE